MSKKQTSAKKPNSIEFEAALSKLETIVRRLEHGGDSLDKSLEDYAEAIGLLKVCHLQLESAERRVEILSGIDANGNPVTEQLEEAEEDSVEKTRVRSKRSTGKKDAGRSKVSKPRSQAAVTAADESKTVGRDDQKLF